MIQRGAAVSKEGNWDGEDQHQETGLCKVSFNLGRGGVSCPYGRGNHHSSSLSSSSSWFVDVQAILARSRSRERAAEAQRRRRLRPKTRVMLSTSASKGSYRILQEDQSRNLATNGGSHKILGDWSPLGGSYQRLGHRTELERPRLQLRSYSNSTPEALQKMQDDDFLFWSLVRCLWSLQSLPVSLWFSPISDQPPTDYLLHVIVFMFTTSQSMPGFALREG